MINSHRERLQQKNAALDRQMDDIRAGERHEPINEANRCPARLGGEHSCWRSKQDGKRRCSYCCQVQE